MQLLAFIGDIITRYYFAHALDMSKRRGNTANVSKRFLLLGVRFVLLVAVHLVNVARVGQKVSEQNRE